MTNKQKREKNLKKKLIMPGLIKRFTFENLEQLIYWNPIIKSFCMDMVTDESGQDS